MFDHLDHNHPRFGMRVGHVLAHVRRENEIRAAVYLHNRMLALLQIMAVLPNGQSSLAELSKLENKLHELIQRLLVGKTVNQSPAKLAKQWTAAWNKAFGNQDDPAVKAKIEAAAEAMLKRR